MDKSRTNNIQTKSMLYSKNNTEHEQREKLIFWNNIVNIVKGESFDFNKFKKLIERYIVLHDRKYTLNLQISFIDDDRLKSSLEPILDNEPFRVEFRLHHGSVNIKEIYNWTNFVCLFMSHCIYYGMSMSYDIDLLKFYNNDQIMFDLLFHNFIKDNNLKQYYLKKFNDNTGKQLVMKNIEMPIDVTYEQYFEGDNCEMNYDDNLVQMLSSVNISDKQQGGSYFYKYMKYKNKMNNISNT